METLLGVNIPGPDAGELYPLPPMRIVQTSVVVRFDQDSGTFVEPVRHSLIHTISSDADGRILFGGEVFYDPNRGPQGPDPECAGTDSVADDNGGTQQPSDVEVDRDLADCLQPTSVRLRRPTSSGANTAWSLSSPPPFCPDDCPPEGHPLIPEAVDVRRE